ncbi:hypothetical protein AAD018_011430 [Aestuariibius insulae]|uniref:hypothetical protein n=1 Tax=Aestuariibius insulae TaxID=2058287 RepID=UPI00345E7763
MSSRSPTKEERALLHLGAALCCRRLDPAEEDILVSEMNRLQLLINQREVSLPSHDKHPLGDTTVQLLSIAQGLVACRRGGAEYSKCMAHLKMLVQLTLIRMAETYLGRKLDQ